MAMLLRFRMLSDEDDNFLRDYLVPYNMSLFDFHNFICDDLGYDPDNMTSFFSSDSRWSKLREFTLMDMGLGEGEEEDAHTPIPMEQVKLSMLIKNNNDRLIYQFDMLEDRALFIELMGAEKSDETEAKVMLANGEAPDQFDAADSPINRSIFDEAMSDFGEYDGDESYSDDE